MIISRMDFIFYEWKILRGAAMEKCHCHASDTAPNPK